jgi:hypothetical protein
MTPLTLADYPQAIAAAEAAVLAAQQGARALAEAVERRRAEFKGIVANDKALSNADKRKDMLAQLELTDSDYLGLQSQHQAAKDAVVMAQIEADLQLRLWQVARLEAEGAIVRERRLGALEY